MRRKVVLSILFLGVFVLISVWFISSQNNTKEVLLVSSVSPDGTYMLEAYRTEPDATVDFSIRVYLVTTHKKKLIYDAYHESKVEIFWLDDDIVLINDKKLNISKGDKYNWRYD